MLCYELNNINGLYTRNLEADRLTFNNAGLLINVEFVKIKEKMIKKRKLIFEQIRHRQGGIILQLILTIVTLVLIGGTMFFLLSEDREKQQIYHRKAISISEYGLQDALQSLHDNPSWNGKNGKTECDDGWYRVKIRRTMKADTLLLSIISEGHYKSVTDSKTCILGLTVANGDSVWTRRSMQ